jgi:hypothetical protein
MASNYISAANYQTYLAFVEYVRVDQARDAIMHKSQRHN